jgi:tetratricopeptide (TPR) repeat protein
MAASRRASALGKDAPEVKLAEAWILYADGKYEETARLARQAIEQKPDCEGADYLLGWALFAAGKYQEVADLAEAGITASGEDYNIYVPVINALGALGKKEALHNRIQQRIQVLEAHLRKIPEDVRARTLLANDYTQMAPAALLGLGALALHHGGPAPSLGLRLPLEAVGGRLST